MNSDDRLHRLFCFYMFNSGVRTRSRLAMPMMVLLCYFFLWAVTAVLIYCTGWVYDILTYEDVHMRIPDLWLWKGWWIFTPTILFITFVQYLYEWFKVSCCLPSLVPPQ